MTYRVQIITAKGEPVIDARVWSKEDADTVMDVMKITHCARVKEVGKRWQYGVYFASGFERVQSTKEMTEAFRLAGLFDQREK